MTRVIPTTYEAFQVASRLRRRHRLLRDVSTSVASPVVRPSVMTPAAIAAAEDRPICCPACRRPIRGITKSNVISPFANRSAVVVGGQQSSCYPCGCAVADEWASAVALEFAARMRGEEPSHDIDEAARRIAAERAAASLSTIADLLGQWRAHRPFVEVSVRRKGLLTNVEQRLVTEIALYGVMPAEYVDLDQIRSQLVDVDLSPDAIRLCSVQGVHMPASVTYGGEVPPALDLSPEVVVATCLRTNQRFRGWPRERLAPAQTFLHNDFVASGESVGRPLQMTTWQGLARLAPATWMEAVPQVDDAPDSPVQFGQQPSLAEQQEFRRRNRIGGVSRRARRPASLPAANPQPYAPTTDDAAGPIDGEDQV